MFWVWLKDVSGAGVTRKVRQGPSHMRLAEVWEKPPGSCDCPERAKVKQS